MRIPLITTAGAKEIELAVALVVGLAVCTGALARAQATQPAPAPPAAVELPATIPLLPLPDVVLFPETAKTRARTFRMFVKIAR